MKLIVAVVRPFTIEKMVVAFEDIENFPGMTVTDSTGFGQRLLTTAYDALDPFKPNKRIEIAANDEMVEHIVAAIRVNAHTGKKGDGIIVVVPVEKAVLI
ncbi:MAG: P-II family nitrogen regulator [Pyrinomonadaceae bacterium]